MSINDTPTPEVWFLTGSQALYGPETLDQVASQSRGIADRLTEQLGDGLHPDRAAGKTGEIGREAAGAAAKVEHRLRALARR